IKPDYAEAYYNMGNALQDQGKSDEAIKAFNKALSLRPDYVEAYYNMGNALQDYGKLDEAIEAFKKALSLKPDYIEAYYNIGNALQDHGKLDEAIASYQKALSLKPDYIEAYYNMGNALKDHRKLDEAIASYQKALALKPDHIEAHNNMGNVLKDQGKLNEAIASYDKMLALKPDFAEAYHNIGNALQDQGKLDEALEAYQKALSLKPDYPDTYNNMGLTLQDQGKLDEALEAYNKALALKPNFAQAYNNMGIALKGQGKLEEAIKVLNKALSLKPEYGEAHINLSFALLNVGELKKGLEEYEWRWKAAKNLTKIREFSIPVWDGQKNLQGKRILLWSEQGIGDTINWVSRLPLISSQAQHCTLECPEKLVPLLRRSFPNVEIKPEDKSRDLQRNDFDFHLPLGSLYRHFIPQILNNPKPDAFLVPDPVRINFWKQRLKSLGPGPYIGVSWKSSNMSPKRLPNYAHISEWCPIFKIDGITYINLQYIDYESDLAKIKSEFGVTVHNFDDLDHYNNIDDVGALCAALDMVVSTKITVPLISSGVGTITKLANWRQSSWSNILLNPVGPAIDIFEKNTWEPWVNVLNEIAADIIKMKTRVNSTSESL
ncbi:MAG: tetratricopeptide repeat protein, partial [Proteobacteria bacterium]|nr:tetratricopeptide repeat protein [Pseudomonadota bacterium]